MFETLESFLPWLIYLNYVVVILVSVRIVLQNRNPVKTNAYILLLISIPIIGLLVFLFFGGRHRKKKLFNKKKLKDALLSNRLLREEYLLTFDSKKDLFDRLGQKRKIARFLTENQKTLIGNHNQVEVLKNGEEKFPELIQCLKLAQNHIHLEYYIIEDGIILNEIEEILINKAREGLEIRIIYDGFGSSDLNPARIEKWEEAGIKVFPFMPVKLPIISDRLNYRDHRKIIVIDGKIGFVGGINISDRYDNRLNENKFWRDTSIKIEGEAVRSLQVAFIFNWYFVSEEFLNDNKKYFPELNIKNFCPVQIAVSGPDSNWGYIMNCIFSAINTAENCIRITTPYFIPSESILTALINASLSGVNVEMLIPARGDSKAVQFAMESYIEELLDAGIKIYRYKKGFVHAKTITVDGIFSMVGTTNMDVRSFDYNFEVSALIYDEKICKNLDIQFNDDLNNAQLLNKDLWDKRNFSRRFAESICRLFSPVL